MGKPWIGALALWGVLVAGSAWGACTGASPSWTSTPDYASVSACVGSARNGDTITVSPGSATWASTVKWTGKDLTLSGTGATITVATPASASQNRAVFDYRDTAGTATRITGFTFVCGKVLIGARGFRVDHNLFTCPRHFWAIATAWWDVATGTSSAGSPKTNGVKGLIDNNTIVHGYIAADDWRIYRSPSAFYGSTHWSTPLGLGTDEAVYIEDNTFYITDASLGWARPIDCAGSGRFVLRFNDITDEYMESHGSQAYMRPCRKWEIYHNTSRTKLLGNVWTPMYMRGGTGMVFNNTATGAFRNSYMYNHQRSVSGGAGENWGGVGTCDGPAGATDWDTNLLANGWPCRDQIGTGTDDTAWANGSYWPPKQSVTLTPAYSWGNIRNAVNATIAINGSTTHLVANRDYYDYTAAFNGTVGVGSGAKAQLDAITTCTPGVAFWVTDQGSWNRKNNTPSVTADGVLYKCAAGNAWTPSYTPYPYPHPLRNSHP